MSRHRRKDVPQSLKYTPNLVFSEAVRNLHTAILMFNLDREREPQVILVSASIPGERKTTMDLAPARYFEFPAICCALWERGPSQGRETFECVVEGIHSGRHGPCGSGIGE